MPVFVRRIGLGLVLGLVATPVLATTGGPDLAQPMGYDSRTRDVYFAIEHRNESGDPATVIRARLGDPLPRFQVVPWSSAAHRKRDYDARLKRLSQRLRPLSELSWTTVPQSEQIVAADSIENFSGKWARYRIRVSGFGGMLGVVEVLCYRQPSVRVRLYQVPKEGLTIPVFSFVGIPWESGYESQVPVLLPADKDSIVRIHAGP